MTSDDGQPLPQGPWGSPASFQMTGSVPQVRARSLSGPVDAAMSFDGEARGFSPLVRKGILLQILTLGIYRFWYTTDLRRLYWAHTSIGGERLDYTGRAVELLKGFLVALTIVVPLKLVAFLTSLYAPGFEVPISFLVILVLIYFGFVAAYSARRYRLARTAFRGLRLRMTGSPWRYGLTAFLWALLVLVTLGLAYPWMAARLNRIQMENTFYGDLQGRFTGRGGALLWRWVTAVLVVLAVAAATFFVLLPFSMEAAVGFAAMVLFLGICGIFPAFVSILLRWQAEGSHFGELHFASSFSVGRSYRLYVGAILRMLLVFVLGGTVIGVVFGAAGLLTTKMPTETGAIIISLGGYIAVIALMSWAKAIYFDLRKWRYIASSLTVYRLDVLDDVKAQNEDASALGEGLSDLSLGL